MKCDHCPRDGKCNGEENKRLCDLVNEKHPDHNPSYLKMLKPPGAIDKVNSFVSAGINYVAAGMPDVSDEVFEKRMEICRACDSYDKEDNKCNLCGCNLAFKCRMATTGCPISKWTASSFIKEKEGCGCSK